ncbi:MAG: hypothetical protein KDB14_23265 [Planctomycetales bacterium]|nr:hypothetical protein [Planctomycetales bacterium]
MTDGPNASGAIQRSLPRMATGLRRLRPYRRMLALAAAVAVAIGLQMIWKTSSQRRPSIGMEGWLEVVLNRDDYRAVPYTHGDAVAVRIAARVPTDGGARYDLRYLTYGPGEHDLGDYLTSPTGQQPQSPELTIKTTALLAEDESGELRVVPPARIGMHSHYWLLMTLLWIGWAALLAPLITNNRHVSPAPPAAPAPSTRQRLIALLRGAAHKPLDTRQQAELEMLTLTYWSERLQLSRPATRLVDIVGELRHHPDAAEQLRLLENWLHSPTGSNPTEWLLAMTESLPESPPQESQP